MAILKADTEPTKLIDFLTKSGVKCIDIDAMEIDHCPSHTFKRENKKFYIIILHTDGPYKGYIEKALTDNNREFEWQ
jgi:hypothetical protein